MTMEAMVKSLEKEGFAVKKKYLGSPVSAYDFDISKGDNHLVMQFKYPVDVSPKEKDNRQREFINRMVYSFNKTFGNKEVNNMDFNADITRTGGEATLCINDHTYPIIIRNIRFEDNCYTSVDWSFEGDIMRYSEYGNYRRKVDDIRREHERPDIKDVIFNDPATIVLWKDGTKTVVKCGEDDIYDPEKGLTMAITKKLYGNKGSYFNEIKKWTDKYWEKHKNTEPTVQAISLDTNSVYNTLKREIDKLYNKLNVSLVVDWDDVNKAIEENLGMEKRKLDD